MRLFYERKTQELEKKLRSYMRGNIPSLAKTRDHNLLHVMEEIKSFKSLLPNSVKFIPGIESDRSIVEATTPTLIK
jgi:hypothetical protein